MSTAEKRASSPGPTPRPPGTSQQEAKAARILRLLLSLPRMLSIYPQGHRRIDSLLTELQGHLAAWVGPLTIALRDNELRCEGEKLTKYGEISTRFETALRQRRIRSLTVLPGVTATELRRLGELFATDFRELFRQGGTEAFLEQARLPHLRFLLHWRTRPARGGSEESAARAGAGDGEHASPRMTEVLGQVLSQPAVVARLRRILRCLESNGTSKTVEVDLVERLVWDFFMRPEWNTLPESRIKEVVESFLEILQESLEKGSKATTEQSDAVFDLHEIVDRLPVHEVLARAMPGAAEDGKSDAEPTYAVDPSLIASEEDLEWATGAREQVRESFEDGLWEESKLLVPCDLLARAADGTEYARRRELLFQSLADRRYPSAAVATAMMHLAFEFSTPQEREGALFAEVLDRVDHRRALARFLASLANRPREARQYLRRVTGRPNPFPILATLLTSEADKAFKDLVADRLVDSAHSRQDALRAWSRVDRNGFFHPDVLRPLLIRSPHVLGPICKEILLDGQPSERQRLIAALVRYGGESGLRLLVLGLSHGDEPCALDVLQAIGNFKSPLAYHVLREIVHRSNTATLRPEEAHLALRMLYLSGTREARAFLWEVATKRFGPFYTFRSGLRSLASEILAGERT